MPSRRAISRILPVFICLLCGVAMTWAVAWWSAFSYPDFMRLPGGRAVQTRPVYRGLNDEWIYPWPTGWPPRTLFRRYESSWLGGEIVFLFDNEDPAQFGVTTHRNFTNLSATGYKFGWPFRALGCWTDDSRSRIQWATPRAKHLPALPLMPLWPGFALNTLFYALLACGFWQLPLVLRRLSRAKRGACVRCGYDLKGLAAGSACPECGPASGVRG